MKKCFLLFPIILALLCSCNANEEGPIPPDSENPALKDERSESEILKIATEAYRILNNHSREEISLSASNIVPVGVGKGRSESQQPDLYAVNYGEGRGFALVSSSRKVEPLIGLIENGDYDADDNSVEPLNNMIDCAEAYVRTKKIITPEDTNKIDFGIKPYYDTIIKVRESGPRVKVNWSSYWPENMFAPNYIAGCAPVALGQAMTFFRTPTQITLTYNSSNQNLILDWDEISKHKRSVDCGPEIPPSFIIDEHNYECGAAAETHTVIGHLMAELGHRMKAIYREDDTEKDTKKETLVSYYMLYNVTKELISNVKLTEVNVFNNIFEDAFSADNIIEIIGYGTDGSKGGGHVWLVDGAFEITRTIYYVTGKGIPATLTYTEVSTITSHYIHNNWGYGRKNGYFIEGVYDMKKNPVTPPASSDDPPSVLYPAPSRTGVYKWVFTPDCYIKISKK